MALFGDLPTHQCGPQNLSRSVEAGFDGLGAAPEDLPDLLVGKLVIFEKEHRGLEVVRQRVDVLAHGAGEVIPVCIICGRQVRRRYLFDQIARLTSRVGADDADSRMALLPTNVVTAEVAGDS